MGHSDFHGARLLGRTAFPVARLGVAGGYGAPAKAFEMAFDRGVNYFYHGSFRRNGMNEAIQHINANGQREKLWVTAQIYMRAGWLFRRSFERFLRKTGLSYVDELLLGWYNHEPAQKIIDICEELKHKGLARHIGISGHNRPFFPTVAGDRFYEFFHVRYNAAHRGAETEVFDKLNPVNKPGVVTFTATRWAQLINPRKTPAGEKTPTAPDCYRFVMTNPSVDVCLAGPSTLEHMEQALTAVDMGPLAPEELQWMRRIGDHLRVK